ncbi:MAG TPA: YceI family protein [Gammaproteobacteria bacterium]|nr:YceI family protein [Gammaproteobacteria bacterium]
MKTADAMTGHLGRLGLLLTVLGLPAVSCASTPYHLLRDAPGGTYRIDPDHSLAWFTIGHARIGIVAGRFDKIGGSFTVNPGHPAQDRVTVRIPAASIDTNEKARDRDLRGPHFFDVHKYPDIRFVSTRFEVTGPDDGRLYGKLTLHGATHVVVFRVHRLGSGPVPELPPPWGGYLTGYVAETTLDRTRFGINADRGMLGRYVHLHVNIEGVRIQPASTAPSPQASPAPAKTGPQG